MQSTTARGLLRYLPPLSAIVFAVTLFFVMSLNHGETYLLPSTAPGKISFSMLSFFTFMTYFAMVFFTATFATSYIYRPQSDCKKKPSLYYPIVSVLSVVLFGITIVLCIIALVNANTAAYSNDYLARLASDPRYCCVFGTVDAAPTPLTVSVTGCPILLTACSPSVTAGQLTIHPMFMGAFILFLILFVLSLVHAVIGYSIWRNHREGADSYAGSRFQSFGSHDGLAAFPTA